MTTRFYFSSTGIPPNSPAFGSWDRTTEADRRTMSVTKDGSAMASFTCWNNTTAGSQTALAIQFSSPELPVGTVLDTSVLYKCVARVQESGLDDDIITNAAVYVFNGTTLQHTIRTISNHSASGEWDVGAFENRRFLGTGAGGTAGTGSYTTVSGDYLVLELGGFGTTPATATGTLSIGSDSGSDLGDNNTDTTANNPWLELNIDIIFEGIFTNIFLPLGICY